MADHVQQIKDRLDITDIVSGYVKLQKSGVNFKARCPFHNEKTPSFYVTPERQIWHCFGCGIGGDMFSFIQQIEGVDFPEALRILAQRAGVQLDAYDPKIKNAKTRLYEVCEMATKFFEKHLHESGFGKRALGYLRERGLTDQTISEFRLGFAPDDWHALGTFLNNCGFNEKEIIDAGLAVRKEPAKNLNTANHFTLATISSYDRFRSRIMFPIADANGQVVGFTGRMMPLEIEKLKNENLQTAPAKYINTPQTLIYDKSRVLYGLAKSKLAIKQANTCLLVEGNMDALMSYQAGVQNVVATSGTALTLEQLRLLQRYATKLNFCFDADQAGAMATRRGIGLALSQKFDVGAVRIADPDCKDPADYVKKYGTEWIKAAAQSQPVIEFYYQIAQEQNDISSVGGKKSVIAAVAPLIRRLASRVEQSHWINQIAGLMRAREDEVRADIAVAKDDLAVYQSESVRFDTASDSNNKSSLRRGETLDILNEALVSVVMKNPALLAGQTAQMPPDLLKPLAARLCQEFAARPDIKLDELIAKVGAEHANWVHAAYIQSQELWQNASDGELKDEAAFLIKRLKQKSITERLQNLEVDIREAEVRKEKARLNDLMAKFSMLARELGEAQKT